MSRLMELGRRASMFGCALAITLAVPARTQTYTCASKTDENAVALRDYIVKLVTETGADPELLETRIDYLLPPAAASSVRIEAGKHTCDKAGQAYHRAFYATEPGWNRYLVVIKVSNTRYVVLDPQERSGEYRTAVIFDERWKELVAFTG